MNLRNVNRTLATTPSSQKTVILTLIIVMSFVLCHFTIYKPKSQKIDIIEIKVNELKKILKENHEIIKNIKDIEEELENIKRKLFEAQTQLPTEKEIPNLLTKISDLGSKVGLEFLLFQPKPEIPKEFYNEVPIDMIVKGNYHTVAQFFDLIAHLPRIVNISNINIKNPIIVNDTIILTTSCIATTFRFTPKTHEENNSEKNDKFL